MTFSEQRPSFGRRLLPCLLDEEAEKNPHRVFAVIARSADVSQGFQDVLYGQIANAVNHTALRLQKIFGPEPAYDFETLTYLGIPDLRYNIVFYAAVKCGYKVLLPSPRNAEATNVSLMKQTNSSKILCSQEMETTCQKIAGHEAAWRYVAIEPLEVLLRADAPSFPYHPAIEEAIKHPVLVLHSSGSTGPPKPVVMTHGTFTVMDNDHNFPTVPTRRNNDLTLWEFGGTPGRMYEPFPPFHLAGFFNKVMVPLYTQAIPVFGPATRPPSGALVAEIMMQLDIRGCLLPPVVAEQLMHEPNALTLVANLDVFCYAGGPLSKTVGNSISSVTSVCQFYGSTEVGQVRQLVPRPEDWSYMEFHPNSKLEFRPFDDDDTFELIVLADAETEASICLNHNLPGIREFQTKDLFKRHHTKTHLWQFYGRKDDILVLSNGEKLNPLPMENRLQGLPQVSGALLVGQGRPLPALLLELKDTTPEFTLEDQIWPAVELENINMPGYGQILRSMVLLAKADKAFIRAGKGTIIRKLTEDLYLQEIEDLYSGKSHKALDRPSPLVATVFALNAINELVRSTLRSALDVDTLRDSDDLYVSGLDSLKTIEATEALKSSLSPHRSLSDLHWLSIETFYSNPSVGQLSLILLKYLNEGIKPQKENRITRMSAILNNRVDSMQLQRIPLTPDRGRSGLAIVMTGTTSEIGWHLLVNLASNPKVSVIYCLNRSSSAQQQWQDKCTSAGIDLEIFKVQLRFLTASFGAQDLGLNPDDRSAIQVCNLMIHMAWKVDFNQSLASFTENIQSVQTLAEWSSSSPCRPRIVFVSSASSVGPWSPKLDNGNGIPEAYIEDFGASMSTGYSESKHIAERLLYKAAIDGDVPVTIVRAGQIAGSSTSLQARWTERELVPSLLKTSQSLGLIPSDMPDVDWIPVDVAAEIAAELVWNDVDTSTTNGPRYYHMVNPRPVLWHDFIPILKEHCGPNAEIVPLSRWIEKLKTFEAANADDLTSKPALKMASFFALVASSGPTTRYQTKLSQRASRTMAELQPVGPTLMRRWMTQSN